MFEGGRNWELFGYDMSKLARQWLVAWRDLLWGHDSPVRQRLDEVVRLRRETGDAVFYQAGKPSGQTGAKFEAIEIPDSLVLSRHLKLPQAAEDQLDTVIGLEVSANSPFAADDTAYGWQILGRSDDKLNVILAIVSTSSVMTYLARNYDTHDPLNQEVWVKEQDTMIALGGFGESKRERHYRQNLIRIAALSLLGFLLLPAIVAVSAGMKRLEAQQLAELASITQREAATATAMRARLATANANIAAANIVVEEFPNPHAEIARLSELLGDDSFLSQFAMTGREIRLRGQSSDAAAVMQMLTDNSAYSNVTAPQAITRIGSSGLEQFFLNMRLADEVAQ